MFISKLHVIDLYLYVLAFISTSVYVCVSVLHMCFSNYFLIIFQKWQSCLSLCQVDENVKIDLVEQRPDDGDGDAAESVNCPVCGVRLPGLDNTFINSHLGKIYVWVYICIVLLQTLRPSKRKISSLEKDITM